MIPYWFCMVFFRYKLNTMVSLVGFNVTKLAVKNFFGDSFGKCLTGDGLFAEVFTLETLNGKADANIGQQIFVSNEKGS